MSRKLAECLLRRKELGQKLGRMTGIHERDLFEIRVKRVSVSDGVDEVTAGIPKMTYKEFDQEYSYYARQLRLIDAAIQQVNWTSEVENIDTCFDDFKQPEDE